MMLQSFQGMHVLTFKKLMVSLTLYPKIDIFGGTIQNLVERI